MVVKPTSIQLHHTTHVNSYTSIVCSSVVCTYRNCHASIWYGIVSEVIAMLPQLLLLFPLPSTTYTHWRYKETERHGEGEQHSTRLNSIRTDWRNMKKNMRTMSTLPYHFAQHMNCMFLFFSVCELTVTLFRLVIAAAACYSVLLRQHFIHSYFVHNSTSSGIHTYKHIRAIVHMPKWKVSFRVLSFIIMKKKREEWINAVSSHRSNSLRYYRVCVWYQIHSFLAYVLLFHLLIHRASVRSSMPCSLHTHKTRSFSSKFRPFFFVVRKLWPMLIFFRNFFCLLVHLLLSFSSSFVCRTEPHSVT